MVGVSDAMQLAVLQNLINSEKTLRRAAEAEAQATRQALETLAQDLASEVIDTLKKQHKQGLAGVPSDVLADRIGQTVQTEMARLRRQIATLPVPATSLPGVEHQHWQQIAAEHEAEISRLREELARWQLTKKPPVSPTKIPMVSAEEAEESITEKKMPSRNDEDAPLPIENFVPYSADFVPVATPRIRPEWFRDWISPHAGLDKDFALIQILGKTGEPYRATVTKSAAYYLGMTSIGGSLGNSITRLKEMGMVTLVKIRWQRISPHLVALTDKGKNAYQMLFGQSPVPQELPQLLARHKSARHTYLILETERHLRAAGYVVERYPDSIETDLGRYEPDLVARFDEQTLYIEAEIRTSKNRGQDSPRHRKWERYWKLTGGEFYVSVVNAAGRRSLLSELRYWASMLEQEAVVWLMMAGDREINATGWDVWERVDIG